MKALLLVAACALLLQPFANAQAGPIPIYLGTASGFAVLAGSAVTNSGNSIVSGNLGVWPGQSITGFPPGVVVNGTVYDGNAIAMQAEQDATTAYNAAAGALGAQFLTGQDLGGMNLTPWVYSFASSAQLTSTLTLNADDVQNAVFIFQIASALTTASSAVVDLINANSTDQVIWQVGSSATLGADTAFSGDIFALANITLDAGASISCGGALALTGAVTMISNNVSVTGSACRASQQQVPEPDMVPLLLAGLIGIVTIRGSAKASRRFRERGGRCAIPPQTRTIIES